MLLGMLRLHCYRSKNSGYALAIGGGGRMQVGYGLWGVFFITIDLFFVSMMFVLRKQRGNLRGGNGPYMEERVCMEEFSSAWWTMEG